MNSRATLYFLSLFIFISCKNSAKDIDIINVNYNDNHISYEGRIGENKTKRASEIYWSGSSIKIVFEGTMVKTTLEDQNGTNYFNIIIDGKKTDVLKLKKGKHTYSLTEKLTYGKHSIELTKRNEWTFGTTLFYGFEITGTKILEVAKDKSLFIEFYGDSITTGHGNEDYTGEDKADGDVTNNYATYAAITAKELNAEYSCIARGGIGIMVSWFNMIMPEMYDRLNPNDPNSKWNFDEKKPDIVVVNLFQNDSWIVNQPNHVEFKRRFGNKKPTEDIIINKYQSFLKKIRKHYPDTSIVCLLGNMDITKENSPWPGYVSNAVKTMGDKDIYTCYVPYKNTPGHPKVEEHQIVAEKLLQIIKTKIIDK
ncbi:SGNH/GDSL hydrolase family protein [Aquimarina algiphila]|uniref:SGNH/GDSL hydrolase family protein n=1 Tax=Aquimarina algiphila TaxID=2047982 RepID=UPI00232BACB7|nr:SGNH/GDSL hydrolase family protein [Aquimarina algiphila]